MSNKVSYKVLITCVNGVGHLNSCLGVGTLLRNRGHQVYFALFDHNKSIIEKHGFHYISLKDYCDEIDDFVNDFINEDDTILDGSFDQVTKFSPLENLKEQVKAGHSEDGYFCAALIEKSKGENIAMLKIIEKIKPDVCLVDQLWLLPWMEKASCPVVRIMSGAPNDLYDGPPSGSGFSLDDPPQLWAEFRELQDKILEEAEIKAKELFQFFNADYKGKNYVRDLGIYIYPEFLDYHELGSPKGNWVRLDSSIRSPEATNFEIPDKLKDKPGKLIYVSMGTVASCIGKLMKLLVNALAKSPHRFIVSTGKHGDSIKLHDNMWGDKFVDQVALLPKVDLFITHGGNNSVVEGLAAGKPLLVLPVYADQIDNAQRIADLKLGSKIFFREFSEEKLLNTIEHVLHDETIRANVARISETLKKSNSSDKVISLIEQLCATK